MAPSAPRSTTRWAMRACVLRGSWSRAAPGLTEPGMRPLSGCCPGWRILGSDPRAEDVSQAFWHACGASQRRAAEYLLSRGADLNWEPDYAHGTPLDAAGGQSTRQQNVLTWLTEQGARSAGPTQR